MFNRYVNYHKLDNLIWVWSTPEPDWYPGKAKVDIIGFDSYPGPFVKDCNLGMYMQLHDIVMGSKLVALTELGPLPDID
jgi:mannan endo-1,4-beta-mannosidase